ncbi:hypothetical protein ACWWJF_25285 [Symbiopectobacterium sp. Eva_TO]
MINQTFYLFNKANLKLESHNEHRAEQTKKHLALLIAVFEKHAGISAE